MTQQPETEGEEGWDKSKCVGKRSTGIEEEVKLATGDEDQQNRSDVSEGPPNRSTERHK